MRQNRVLPHRRTYFLHLHRTSGVDPQVEFLRLFSDSELIHENVVTGYTP